LPRVPTSITWKRGLPLNCATERVPARGKMSMSLAISAAVCAAVSDMKRNTKRSVFARFGSR
jgi:hypothetical protein